MDENNDRRRIEIDCISELPDNIIHHILSFLPKRDVARSSVLSKTWHRFWRSFPVSDLDFCESLFGLDSKTLGTEERRVEFASFVHNSVLKQYNLKTSIQRFRLSMTYNLHSPVAPRIAHHVDESLEMVAQCCVPLLDLDFKSSDAPPFILSAEALTILRLSRCKLKVPHPTINWPSLRELCLRKVPIDEEIIRNLNMTCPLIEKFAVVRCSRFERIKLSVLTKLKKVKIKVAPYDSNHVEKIEIDAPYLQILNYHGGHIQCKLDVKACKNLQILKLKSAAMGDRECGEFISKFQYLKILALRDSSLMTIDISNQQLEKLQLSSYVQAVINTPRLQSFKCNFTPPAVPVLVDRSSLQEVTIKLSGNLNTRHWLELREYLGNFNQVKLLTLHIRPRFITFDTLEVEHHFALPALPDIDHFKLEIDLRYLLCKDENNYEALVDGLLWVCHPESISLMSPWEGNGIFMRFLCKKLMHRGTDQLCCSSSNIKCWQHDLKDFEIEHCKGNGARKALTCVTLLDYLESLAPLEKMLFTFQW